VITALAVMQAAGGLDYLLELAEAVLRRNPAQITVLAPIVTYALIFVSGTQHVIYALLPIIAEVSRKAGIRPERPLSISVIASQQGLGFADLGDHRRAGGSQSPVVYRRSCLTTQRRSWRCRGPVFRRGVELDADPAPPARSGRKVAEVRGGAARRSHAAAIGSALFFTAIASGAARLITSCGRTSRWALDHDRDAACGRDPLLFDASGAAVKAAMKVTRRIHLDSGVS
jgi:hypothetical protein